MKSNSIEIGRNQVVGVLIANGLLCIAALAVTGKHLLGGTAAIAMISIASLLRGRTQRS